MSRQQFLAELAQYLTFVTPAERDLIIATYDERFDREGPEGEASLLMELGTPMSIAIALKRRMESGELVFTSEPEDAPSEEDEPPAPDETQEAPEIEADYSPEPQEPAQEDLAFEDVNAEEPQAQDEPPPPDDGFRRRAQATRDPNAASASDRVLEQMSKEEIPAIGNKGCAPQLEREPPPPRKELTPGGVIGGVVLSLIIIALFVTPMLFGGYLVLIMMNFVIGALRTLSTLTDALWMFALGLSSGALGLLIFWFFLWAIISVVRRQFLGKPAEGSGFRRGMKKVWRVVWILFAILLVLGIACGVIAFVLNGAPSDLFTNSVAVGVLDWVVDNPIINFVLNLFAPI